MEPAPSWLMHLIGPFSIKSALVLESVPFKTLGNLAAIEWISLHFDGAISTEGVEQCTGTCRIWHAHFDSQGKPATVGLIWGPIFTFQTTLFWVKNENSCLNQNRTGLVPCWWKRPGFLWEPKWEYHILQVVVYCICWHPWLQRFHSKLVEVRPVSLDRTTFPRVLNSIGSSTRLFCGKG